MDERIVDILLDCTRVSGLQLLIENSGDVYLSGFFAPEGMKMARMAMDRLVAKMRPHLIPLSEAIAFHEIPSNIGNKYGDIYELQLDLARNSRLNKLDKDGVPCQWEEHIKPFLHGLDTNAKL